MVPVQSAVFSILLLGIAGAVQASTVVVTAFDQLPNRAFYDWPVGNNIINPFTVGSVGVTPNPNPTTFFTAFGGLLAPELGPSVPGNGGGFGSEPLGGSAATPLILNFNQPVAAFGVTFVHYSLQGQTFYSTFPAMVEVFSGSDATGTLLGTAVDGGGGLLVPTAQFRALWSSQLDIRSARISATSSPDGGFWVDGFGISLATQVPEPSTAGLVLIALVALTQVRRRSRLGCPGRSRQRGLFN